MRTGPSRLRVASGKSRILVAGEEPRIAAFLEKGLRANGYATERAEGLMQTLRLAGSGRFDLLVLDVARGADAAELLRRLEELGVALPVVVLSGSGRPRANVADVDLDAYDWLAKPFAFDDLLALVQAKLAPHRRT